MNSLPNEILYIILDKIDPTLGLLVCSLWREILYSLNKKILSCDNFVRDTDLKLIIWAASNGCSPRHVVLSVIKHNKTFILQWLSDIGYPLTTYWRDMCIDAASYRSLDFLIWLFDNCREFTASYKSPKLYEELLKTMCIILTSLGDTHTLTWIFEKYYVKLNQFSDVDSVLVKFPWKTMCSTAAKTGQLNILIWIRNKTHSKKWKKVNKKVYLKAIKNNKLEILDWCELNGCLYIVQSALYKKALKVQLERQKRIRENALMEVADLETQLDLLKN
jgi:hypothetical protein